MEVMNDDDDQPHYHFKIGLRVRHPDADPNAFTQAFGVEPRWSWEAGQPRTAPDGTLLTGTRRETYWIAPLAAGQHDPLKLDSAIFQVLSKLASSRDVLREIRQQGGSAELFIGWFFHRPSGEILSHRTLALAGDLEIDLDLDVYPHVYPPDPPRRDDVRP